MDRRSTILALGTLLVLMQTARGQTKGPARVGFLGSGSPETSQYFLDAFKQGMAELGYVEGRDVIYEIRWARNDPTRFPSLAKELISLRPDVIASPNAYGPKALLEARSPVPVVFSTVSDPVAFGFVKSLSSPGGNFTGLALGTTDHIAKLLEFLREVDSSLSSIGVLAGPDIGPTVLPDLNTACRQLGVEMRTIKAATPGRVRDALDAVADARLRHLVVVPSGVMNANRQLVVEEAAKHGLLTSSFTRDWVQSGALMAYGATLVDQIRESATYVDKILRGTKPADLPVQLPSKLHFALNLKTAKSWGISVPRSLLLRADEVIE